MLAPTTSKEQQPEYDEANPRDNEAVTVEITETIVEVEVLDEEGASMDVDLSADLEPAESERVIKIGPNNYTLVLRGNTLGIKDHRRHNTSTEEQLETPQVKPRRVSEALEVFDSHLHLDRLSKRLLNNGSLTME